MRPVGKEIVGALRAMGTRDQQGHQPGCPTGSLLLSGQASGGQRTRKLEVERAPKGGMLVGVRRAHLSGER